MANPKRDNEKAARAMIDAQIYGDKRACELHDISPRTLRHYRAMKKKDKQLAAIHAEHARQVIHQHWAQAIDQTLTSAAHKLLALIDGATSSDPETITAVTGAITGLAEIAMTRDVLQAQLEPIQPHMSEKDTAKYVN